jgi:hypothetical protein
MSKNVAEAVASPRQNRSDEVRAKIAAVAAAATDPDRKIVSDILNRASKGDYGSEIFNITPAAAALLFLEHNPHNRDWDPAWSLELSRRQRMRIWRKNNEVPGFYRDGNLADGQHRFAGIALSGITWTTVVVFGMDRDSITTVDAGRRRDAASALKMDGMQEAKLKQSIIKTGASYLLRTGQDSAALRSEVEIADAIHSNNGVLEAAIEIAQISEQNLVNPVLKQSSAATVAYLMLTHGWPAQRVREKMALFQTGQSTSGESEPFFVAGEIIGKAKEKKDTKDRLSTIKEVGLVLHAMRLSTQGVRAIGKQKLMLGIKKELPKADYPGEITAEAAE